MIGMSLFVYGSLKKDHSRNNFLSEQRYLGVAKTSPKYQMYKYSSFPALVETDSFGTSIFGELYEVRDNCFEVLDEIEGTSTGLFKRGFIEIESFTPSFLPLYENTHKSIFESKKAFAYFFVDKNKLLGIKQCGDSWLL